MSAYTITSIRRDSGELREDDFEKIGKQFRIITLEVGEPAVLNYVEEPIRTLWTPKVVSLEKWIDASSVDGWDTFKAGDYLTIECEGISYQLLLEVEGRGDLIDEQSG